MDKKSLISLFSLMVLLMTNFITQIANGSSGSTVGMSGAAFGVAILHAITVTLEQEQNKTGK